jgi:hypothetical protein
MDFFDNPSNTELIEINIKNINDYEIYFHKRIMTYKSINVYEGKNIKTKEKIIVEVYDTDIIFLAKRIKNKIIKIDHPNIISILDVIIEFSNIYIIKPYYKTKLINANINDFIKIKQIIRGMKFLFDKNIDFEQININNIYYDDKNNLLKLSPFLSPPIIQKNILYGSPLYSPPEISNINRYDKEKKILLNLNIIFFELFNDNNMYIIKYIKNMLEFDNCSFIDIYNFFEKNKTNTLDNNLVKINKIKNLNILNDEMFIMEM